MNSVMQIAVRDVSSIPFQEASLDIWDKKYRLVTKEGEPIDRSMDDTYQRVARALADVELPELREHWNERFLWALRRGALPAGRVTSNAGAWEHKPATSTINCTVSGTIRDSMDDILGKVHEAGLTLKAGCVAPGTLVRTERGLVTADEAVHGQHRQILCYDREARRFEMRAILAHLTTHVPRAENIRIHSNGLTLTTSIRHPVLVHRDGQLIYVRADEIGTADALVHRRFSWAAAPDRADEAWFAGSHLGDGCAYPKQFKYRSSRKVWAARARARAFGQRLIFKIRAAEREVVERYAAFFASYAQSRASVVAAVSVMGTPVWDYTVASYGASRAVDLIGRLSAPKSAAAKVHRAGSAPSPNATFCLFWPSLIDTDGTVSTERGSAIITLRSQEFAAEIKALLALFGVHGALTIRRPHEHWLGGPLICDSGTAMLEISDSTFLACVAKYMADSGKRDRILQHATTSGQYDVFQMPSALRSALELEATALSHWEKQLLGFCHGYHQRERVSRVWLDRWARRFSHLAPLIEFALTLRPVDRIERELPSPGNVLRLLTVERHNNYLAGNGGLAVIHELRHRLRILHPAPPRSLRLGGRCLHLRPPFFHGYLRQDVLYRVVCGRSAWCADGDLRCRPSGCHGLRARETRARPITAIQPVAADHG